MAKRDNELFIGTEFLNEEGRTIKHPSLIKLYANVNAKKVNEKPISLIGMDLETDADKGDLKLLGIWDGSKYRYYTKDFIIELFTWVKAASSKESALAYWNRLDPFVILKEFLRYVSKDEKQQALARFGKISGEYNKKERYWEIHPVVQVKIGDYHFGIIQAIHTSIQFFFYRDGFKSFKKVWAYDIAGLYQNGLEKEATARFDYYSKVDKSAHLVDWERFNTNNEYKYHIVLRSNELDARACYDLGMSIQDDFFTAFKYYPRSLISAGSLARSAIVANIFNRYSHLDEAEQNRSVADDVKSIGFMNYYDEWTYRYGQDIVKDLYALSTEAYSGGYIEAIRYGYSKDGYFSDIASAYPGVIQNLLDLRGAKLTNGTGTPPEIKNSYCFIRGIVDIPEHVNFHPITIKHPIHKETNIRATGKYRASYTLNERKFLLDQGATFSDETWINIETTGKLSSLAKVCIDFIDLRKKFLQEGNSSQYIAKIAANSLYGILFEAVDTYTEYAVEKQNRTKLYDKELKQYLKSINLNPIKDELKYLYGNEYKKLAMRWHNKDGYALDELKQELEAYGIYLKSDTQADIFNEINHLYSSSIIETERALVIDRNGYRAGEFWNPIYASIITSETRILMSKAATAIENNGGKVILMMTDSLFWTGSADMIPKEYVKEEKTLGYFEKVDHVKDIVCLGSGRYGYRANKGYYVAKKRGLNAATIQDASGIDLTEFNWFEALKVMEKLNSDKLNIKVRTLISPGLVLHDGRYTYDDLGRIVEQNREIEAIVGKNKRFYDDGLKQPKLLAKQLINTQPIYLLPNMLGKGIVDQTLPELRNRMMKLNIITRNEKNNNGNNDRVKKHYNKNARKNKLNSKYKMLLEYGYDATEARQMQHWSLDRINATLKKDGL